MGMILQHELYGPGVKYVKFYEGGLSAIDAANTAAKMPLNDIRVQYDQFARMRVVLQKEAKNVAVNVPVLGESITMLVVKAVYDNKNKDMSANFLQYKIGKNSTQQYSCTDIVLLTGTAETPVPTIYMSNPSKLYNVSLDVFALTTVFDTNVEGNEFDVFIKGLLYTDLRSADPFTTAVYFNELVEAYFSNETLVNVEASKDRLMFDDPALGRVALQFISEAEAAQALSAVKWMLDSPATRVLSATTPKDETAPSIMLESRVSYSNGVYSVLLPLMPGATLTKANITDLVILKVQDNRDGIITLPSTAVTLKDVDGMTYSALDTMGNYVLTFDAADIAGNKSSVTVELGLMGPDSFGPRLTLNPGITGDPLMYTIVNDPMMPAAFLTKEQLCAELVVSCVDMYDGAMMLLAENITVISAATGLALQNASFPGNYEVYIDVHDSSNNVTSAYIDVMLVNQTSA